MIVVQSLSVWGSDGEDIGSPTLQGVEVCALRYTTLTVFTQTRTRRMDCPYLANQNTGSRVDRASTKGVGSGSIEFQSNN